MSSENVKMVQTQHSINIFGWIGGWVDEYITGFTEIITQNKKNRFIFWGVQMFTAVLKTVFAVLGHLCTHYALKYETMK